MCSLFKTGMERAECLNKLKDKKLISEKMKQNFPNEMNLVLLMIKDDPIERPSADEILTNEYFKILKEENR